MKARTKILMRLLKQSLGLESVFKEASRNFLIIVCERMDVDIAS
jgi:hypothetical protein